uniref:Uncharacterized protein n=1 Tax=Agrobacterium tumefaciens TaxID=358 RepID=A0A3Q8AYH9_AGRTU|nr:hypothetical protein AgrTiEU6_4 [Agrobacterium tumefaciens]
MGLRLARDEASFRCPKTMAHIVSRIITILSKKYAVSPG